MLKLFLGLVLVFIVVTPVSAITNPLQFTNNRYGIHIVDEHDLPQAAELVNSNGGEWGYVTIVIRDNDRNLQKWQNIFNKMRQMKLIPIIRIATRPEKSDWVKPYPHQVAEWVGFLNSLNWVIQNRYIVLFNEPNHAKEWGGTLNPEEYVELVKLFHQHLKASSADYFILPAGLDAAAPDGPDTMSAKTFLKKMYAADSTVFSLFDGWVSHSYPNPAFSGSPKDDGFATINGFRHEIAFAETLGLKRDLPIFITETGWQHQEGRFENKSLLPLSTVEKYYQEAFVSVWNYPQIAAVTPFILNYQNAPFDHFSFIKAGSEDPLSIFHSIKNMDKVPGNPAQIHYSNLDNSGIPAVMVTDSDYTFISTWKNIGQSVWEPGTVTLNSWIEPEGAVVVTDPVKSTLPFEDMDIAISVRSPKYPGFYKLHYELRFNNQPFGEIADIPFRVVSPPNLLVKAQVWYQRISSGTDFTLLIYDEGNLVKKIENFSIVNGTGTITQIHDIVPEKVYRFVLLKPQYLPRQVYAYLTTGETVIEFERLLPIDFNQDGKLSLSDSWNALIHPVQTIKLLKP